MRPEDIKLAKQLASALLELFPLGGIGKFAKISVDHFLSIDERNASRKSVEGLAEEIAAQLAAIPAERLGNPGSAQAAALDVADILKKSALGPERLVALNLDSALIEGHLLAAGQEYIAKSSRERAGFVAAALKLVADSIVNSAAELPGVNVAFMQAMLRSRNASTGGLTPPSSA